MAVLRSEQHGNADERIQEPTCRECQYGYSSQQKSSYPPVYGKRTSTITPQNDVVGSWKEAAPVSVRDFSATAYYFGRLVNEILEVPVGLVVAAWGGSACEAWMTADWLKAFPDAKIPQSEADIKSKTVLQPYSIMVCCIH